MLFVNMPTSYYIITNEYIEDLVNNNDLANLENYLNSTQSLPIHSEGTGHMCVAPWVDDIDDSYDLRLYHILSYATDVGNINVLEHFKNQINLNYRPDGNSYNLLDLAIENYVDKYLTSDTEFYPIAILLVKSHISNHNLVPNGYQLRYLIDFGSSHSDYKLLTQLVREYGLYINEVYHYSIAWGYQDVFDYLVENFNDLIQYEITSGAIEIAVRFNNHAVAQYVGTRVAQLYPALKDKLDKTMDKCGINSSTFILTKEHNCSKLVIPNHITHVETTFDFDQEINLVVWPGNLISIKFGPNFNQPITKVKFPDTVQHISFGINNNWSNFSQSLKNFYFPKSLVEYINQGPGVKESVDNIMFPDSTKRIKLGYKYNMLINNFKS